MSFEPFMWAIYCDDIRQEVGNKASYLGIYGPNLIVQSFPTTLLKLCCVCSVRVPSNAVPKQVTFQLLRNDEVLFEAELSPGEVTEVATSAVADGAETRVLTITSVAQLVNFEVSERCFLKTRAYVDGKELRGGALELLEMNLAG